MKAIIQRALPLNQTYTLIDKKYIPLEQGSGCGCDNCGKLIANIATIRSEVGVVYNIGFDCLDTILQNNAILSTGDLAQYEAVKKMIPKILRFAKHIKERQQAHPSITGLLFEKHTSFNSEFYPFYWLQNGQQKSRDNDYVKLKEMDFAFLLATLKNIFPKFDIITEQ